MLTRDDPREDMPSVAASTDFVFLQLGGNNGQPGSGNELYSDGDTFRIRAERAAANSLPVLGWFNLDAGYPLWQQKSNKYGEYSNRPYTEREGLKTILETWRKPGTFSWGLKADDGNWLPMNGIVLCLYETTTHTGQSISGQWQTWVLDDTIKYLNIFMDGGYIPKVPIYVYSNPGFFETYKDTLGLYLKNRLDAGEINGIGYGVPLYPQVPTSETLSLADVSTQSTATRLSTSTPICSTVSKARSSSLSIPGTASRSKKSWSGITPRALYPSPPGAIPKRNCTKRSGLLTPRLFLR